jgi:electron transport complex protein RnfD
VVTGLLLSMNLPAKCPWWLPVVGALFAIVFVKQLYGGIGKNFLNSTTSSSKRLMASKKP